MKKMSASLFPQIVIMGSTSTSKIVAAGASCGFFIVKASHIPNQISAKLSATKPIVNQTKAAEPAMNPNTEDTICERVGPEHNAPAAGTTKLSSRNVRKGQRKTPFKAIHCPFRISPSRIGVQSNSSSDPVCRASAKKRQTWTATNIFNKRPQIVAP